MARSAAIVLDRLFKERLDAATGITTREHLVSQQDAYKVHVLIMVGALTEPIDAASRYRVMEGEVHVLVGGASEDLSRIQEVFENVLALHDHRDWRLDGWYMQQARVTGEQKHIDYPAGAKSAARVAYEARFAVFIGQEATDG
ncbi:MAG: hypothetical protein OXI72_10940 [Gemmatimonadota bacterium]|nr:hypothetical protein [Gemmatimonadota bacterium]